MHFTNEKRVATRSAAVSMPAPWRGNCCKRCRVESKKTEEPDRSRRCNSSCRPCQAQLKNKLADQNQALIHTMQQIEQHCRNSRWPRRRRNRPPRLHVQSARRARPGNVSGSSGQ